ncbi:MAG TPA: pyridoxamine 5'-phosphate oxidase family protein [Dehalococcoidia bacterium]|nr:pyridoxamine 5'-phosphate oxidase family protein [Dehalococcoidia bacterium]
MTEQQTVTTPPELVRDRPGIPQSYGIQSGEEGMLPWAWARRRLEVAQNYWICSTRPDGRPHAMPVWGVWVDDVLLFGTGRDTRKARNIAANPHVAMHLESGDDAVMVEGVVEELRDAALLAKGDAAYLAKYIDPATGEGFHLAQVEGGDSGVYCLRPRLAQAWREANYPVSATRWRFGIRGVA